MSDVAFFRCQRRHINNYITTRLGEPSTAPGRVEGGGQPVLSFEQCFILFSSFPLLLAFVVGGLGFEFCVFVAGWRHALLLFGVSGLLLLYTTHLFAALDDDERRHLADLGHAKLELLPPRPRSLPPPAHLGQVSDGPLRAPPRVQCELPPQAQSGAL